MTSPFPHSRRGCEGVPHMFRGTSGDRMAGCKACHTYVLAESLTPKVDVTSGYACRVHMDQPTTWRGTGCATCRHEAELRNYTERKVLRDYFV